MNKPNPSFSPGSFPGSEGVPPSRIKFAVFTVLAIHAVALMGVLIQGCKDSPAKGNGLAANSDAGLVNVQARAATSAPAPKAPPVSLPAVNPVKTPPAGSPHPAEPASRQPATEYAVAKGDGFYTIAKAHGVTVKALASANPGVDSTKLKIGQVLKIPASGE